MAAAVRTSETSVNLYDITRRIIPEDNHMKNGFSFYFLFPSLASFLSIVPLSLFQTPVKFTNSLKQPYL
jgi:hypothetical protein